MADLILTIGETKPLKFTFFDDQGKAITPPQQMVFACASQDITLGQPTAPDTLPVTAGSNVAQGIVVSVSAPGINNGNGAATVSVVSNIQTGPVSQSPTAQSVAAQVG